MYTWLMVIAVLVGLLAVGLYRRARTITPGEPGPKAKAAEQPLDNSGE